jgi:hypothetical protein
VWDVFAWLYFSDKNAKWLNKNTFLPLLKHLETNFGEKLSKASLFILKSGPVRDKHKASAREVHP